MFCFRNRLHAVFTKIGATLSYEVRFKYSNVQKKTHIYEWIFTKNQGRMAAVPPMLTNETLMGSDRVHFFFAHPPNHFNEAPKQRRK
jgi:hypothetical protein